MDFKEGVVIPIYKPYDWTSFDVVRKVKNLILTKFRNHPTEKTIANVPITKQ